MLAVFVGLSWVGARATERSPAGTRQNVQPHAAQAANDKLEDRVKSALFATIGNEARQVGIEVRDGFVLLSGSVRTEATRTLAEQAVERVLGVRSVDNALAVKRQG